MSNNLESLWSLMDGHVTVTIGIDLPFTVEPTTENIAKAFADQFAAGGGYDKALGVAVDDAINQLTDRLLNGGSGKPITVNGHHQASTASGKFACTFVTVEASQLKDQG